MLQAAQLAFDPLVPDRKHYDAFLDALHDYDQERQKQRYLAGLSLSLSERAAVEAIAEREIEARYQRLDAAFKQLARLANPHRSCLAPYD